LFEVAVYAADARARELLLIIPTFEQSDEVYDQGHDWYQLLSRTNSLHLDLAIASGLRIAAWITAGIGLTLAIYLLLCMAWKKPAPVRAH
jgi:hypothetical protein